MSELSPAHENMFTPAWGVTLIVAKAEELTDHQLAKLSQRVNEELVRRLEVRDASQAH